MDEIKLKGSLNSIEITNTERYWVRAIQRKHFPKETLDQRYSTCVPPSLFKWPSHGPLFPSQVAAVGEWSRNRIVAGLVTSLSPVPLKTYRVGERCTFNPSRAQTSSRWCGAVVRRGGASSGVVHVT
ncbi:uncharacterized protein TNCV_873451 [Trichonephila clavipes]|nr:uncharacterized protein TNCV_873451 [Trichonephila clavipes]